LLGPAKGRILESYGKAVEHVPEGEHLEGYARAGFDRVRADGRLRRRGRRRDPARCGKLHLHDFQQDRQRIEEILDPGQLVRN